MNRSALVPGPQNLDASKIAIKPMLLPQKELPRDVLRGVIMHFWLVFLRQIRTLNFSYFWHPSDRSKNAKVQGGNFCYTSPAKFKISSHWRRCLGASNSFRSLYVRFGDFWRPLQIRSWRRRWVDAWMSISRGLLFTQKANGIRQLGIPRSLRNYENLQIRQVP